MDIVPPCCRSNWLYPVLSCANSEILIERFARHVDLPTAARVALRQMPLSYRELAANDYLVREADAPVVCAILLTGFAFRQKIIDTGHRQIVAICIPGEVVDLQNLYLDVADHSVQMLTAGSVLTFPRQALQAIIELEPAVAKAVVIDTLIDASIGREWITNIGRRSAKTRMAHLLCEFAARLANAPSGGEVAYDLPMTQEQLGDALGLTGIHVNRMLRGLAKDGLVTSTKRSVHVADIKQLERAGDFNSRYLHRAQGVQR